MIAADCLRDAARVYALFLALIALAACSLALVGAGQARALMPLGFARLKETPATATRIALDNARVALLPFGLALLAHHGGPLRRAADTTLLSVVALNTVLLGAALAGYGARSAVALAPHLPVELAAYAVAGGAYLAGRRAPLGARELALLVLLSAALVALAAVIETYVQLRLPT